MIGSENTCNCMITLDRILNDKTYMISASALLLVLRRFYYVGRHVYMTSASALLLVFRHFYYVGRHVYMTNASALLLVFRHFYYVGMYVSVQYCSVPSGIYCTESNSFFISGPRKQILICMYLNKKR